jgi:hypothetical protein
VSTEGDEHDDDAEQSRNDVIIGTAVESLLEDGDEQAAALLLDVLSFRAVYIDTGFSMTSEETTDLFDVVLLVPRFIEKRFTEDVSSRIHSALSEAARSAGIAIMNLRTETPLTEPGWRERAEARLGQGPSNQGTAAPPPKRWITEDRMRFRDVGERNVYRAFKRAQQRLPSTESITILPNASARPFVGHTWEPDFVIATGAGSGSWRSTARPTRDVPQPTRAGTTSSRTLAWPTWTAGRSRIRPTTRPWTSTSSASSNGSFLSQSSLRSPSTGQRCQPRSDVTEVDVTLGPNLAAEKRAPRA